MICIDALHLSIHRILLLAVGLWPYQRSKFVQLQTTLQFSILASFVVFQFTAIATVKYNFNLIIKILSCALFFTCFIIKYNLFWINIHTVRYLLEQLQNTHNELKDKNEIAIIRKYACNGERYTTVLIFFTICSVFSFIILSIWSSVFCTLRSTKETNSHSTTQIVVEYFIDQEKYIYLILLHTNTALCIGATVVLATGTIFLMYLKHACGMFKIASYRIEQAMAKNALEKITLQKKISMYKKMIYAVDIHRKAMMLSETLVSSFESLFFSYTVIGVLCLSLNLFRVLTILNNAEEDLLLHLLNTATILIYMFLVNFLGQEITDHNNHVFLTAYNARWYSTPLHIQKLILFLLQRSSKSFNLHVGSTFVASLETFATLTSASISYFTVIYSTQQ